MAKFYVYTLAYPVTVPFARAVFYVGKGQGKRVKAHETEAKSLCGCRKCEVIRHIWGVGAQVLREIIYETDDESEALRVEQEAINGTYASPYLVNLQHNPIETHLPIITPKQQTPVYAMSEGDMGALVSGMSMEDITSICDEFLGPLATGDPSADRDMYSLIWDVGKDVPSGKDK